jgi:hypothetical protein
MPRTSRGQTRGNQLGASFFFHPYHTHTRRSAQKELCEEVRVKEGKELERVLIDIELRYLLLSPSFTFLHPLSLGGVRLRLAFFHL